MKRRFNRLLSVGLALVLAAAWLARSAVADPHAEGDLSSYAYVEAFDGRGRVEHAWESQASDLSLHYPLSPGDRVVLEPGAQLALILPDRTRVRVSGPADLVLARMALARDEPSTVSEIVLTSGELQLVVGEDFLADELPIVELRSGAVFVHEPGSYVFYADYDWSTATTRDGFAELSTERGSAIVREGETLTIEGGEWPRLSLRRAGGESPLEGWSRTLDEERYRYGSGYVDRSLWHSSAPLEQHGSWIQVSGRHAWSPHVSRSWRPFYDGRWIGTRSGYTWVSSEPWGWVTYHYGSWDYSPSYGWVWYPGRVYSPAWVYWHWSPTYVGWAPTGYYSSYYGGLHLGVHGYSSASWSTYSLWNFCRTRDVGRRDAYGYVTTGYDLSRTARSREVPRGLVTTDTRPVDPRELARPEEFGDRIARSRGRTPNDLPDVSEFVARRDVPGELAGKIRTRVPAPRAPQPDAPTARGGSEERSGMTARTPVLHGSAPGAVRDRRIAAPQSRTAPPPTSIDASRETPRGGMRYVAPGRTSPGVSPPRAGSRSVAPPPSSRPVRGVPTVRPRTPQSSGVERPTAAPVPGTAAAPTGRSTGRQVLDRIRSHRQSTPSPPPARSSAPTARPTTSEAPPPSSRATSSSSRSSESSARSGRSSRSSSSSSARSSSSSSRSSSARSTRPSQRSSDSDDD